ncbi:CbtA family protein [Sneathiella limimaris]|uniref:CbtA family protein n=1 Tax=Sneathiella limimaris TaxID=1964213 RepID=UPI00146A044D|nr:CbtA family protein [Sneathiella limimaris]
MFTRIVTSALFAGAAAGFIASLLQLYFVQPVLLHAELYESGQLVHFGNGNPPSAQQDVGGFEAVRDGLSIGFSIVIYCGYALLMVAAMAFAEERGAKINARTGLLWGIAGFIAFQFAPAFTLAPEVPGVAAADVYLRQGWWFATAGATAIALWLIAFQSSWLYWGAAVVLLLAPHVVGAPEPDYFTGPVPTEIGALFASRALGIGFAAWVLTGMFAGYFWQREQAAETAA